MKLKARAHESLLRLAYVPQEVRDVMPIVFFLLAVWNKDGDLISWFGS